MAAASLAHAGRSVLVAERAEGPGGYARAFERGGYTFDPAVHVIPQAGPDSLLQALFDHLGVGEMMDFRQVGVFSARLPGREFTAPVGLAELTAAVAAEFPGDAKGIEAFFGSDPTLRGFS